MGELRTLQYPCEVGGKARAATGNRRTVLSVPHVAQTKFAGAAAHGGQSRAADQWIEFPGKDFVAQPHRAGPAGVVAEVEAAVGVLVGENGEPLISGESVGGRFGGK